MKTCKKCKETKALELFSKAARGRDGYAPRCKSCAREDAKAVRDNCLARDPEQYRAKQKAKKEKYKDIVTARAKAYYESNKTEINKRKQARIKQRLETDAEFKERYTATRKALYERKKDSTLARQKKNREELSDSYVKSLLGFHAEEYVAPDVIQTKRQQVIEKRLSDEQKRNSPTRVCTACNIEKDKNEFYRTCSKCKSCVSEYYKSNYKYNYANYGRAYYQKNSEKAKAYAKEYYKNNREHMRELARAWAAKYPDRLAETRKRYAEKNREAIAERARNRWKAKWDADPDKVRAEKRAYYEAHPDRVKAYNRKCLKRYVREASDWYVNRLLNRHVPKGMNNAVIPKELIEAKRLELLIKRKIKDENNHTTKR